MGQLGGREGKGHEKEAPKPVLGIPITHTHTHIHTRTHTHVHVRFLRPISIGRLCTYGMIAKVRARFESEIWRLHFKGSGFVQSLSFSAVASQRLAKRIE